MRTALLIRTHALLERYFPERRVFLRSDNDTRFIRLRPGTQLVGFTGCALLVSWAIIATAILLMDSIGAGNFREQAKRDQQTYQARLNDLSPQRDERADEALAAQERFNAALAQISVDAVGTAGLRNPPPRARDRDRSDPGHAARHDEGTRDHANRNWPRWNGRSRTAMPRAAIATSRAGAPIDFLADALARHRAERDKVIADAQDALLRADELAT